MTAPTVPIRGKRLIKSCIAGMSHVASLSRGWAHIQTEHPDMHISFHDLREARTTPDADIAVAPNPSTEHLVAGYRASIEAADSVVFMLQGNQHNAVGLVEVETMAAATRLLDQRVAPELERWLTALLPCSPRRVFLLLPPPPIEHLEHLLADRKGNIQQLVARYGLRNAGDRLALWRHQCDIIRRVAASRGISVIELPADVFSETGLLHAACCGDELTHGNTEFGRRVMQHVVPWLLSPGAHPYYRLPSHAYWQQAVADVAPADIDPMVTPRVMIGPEDLVATAGSCFAQHLSRCLDGHGLQLLKAETNTADGTPCKPYEFSARYGNLYTARQLLQLLERAFGHFQPLERVWVRPDGRLCDPFRPRIEPDGYPDEDALFTDVERHLAAVRRMFLELDVLVFTLGLTESWASRCDGAVYPVAPGVVCGEYLPEQHQFVNFTVAEVISDMEAFLARLAEVNPNARMILTVSPVPMVATREPRHVMVSNAYSKSVLRAAAGQLSTAHEHVDYFPSYEIITSTATPDYFGPDRRSVTEAGIQHVMRVFGSRVVRSQPSTAHPTSPIDSSTQAAAEMVAAVQAECDEELYRRE